MNVFLGEYVWGFVKMDRIDHEESFSNDNFTWIKTVSNNMEKEGEADDPWV